MKRRYLYAVLHLALMLATIVYASPASANLPISSLVVLKGVPIYDDNRDTEHQVGVISATQEVIVKETVPKWDENEEIKWFLVETWLGDKWIQASDKVATGGYRQLDRVITLVQDTALFDLQKDEIQTGMTIKPQKVKVVGIYNTFNYRVSNATSVGLSTLNWYQIETEFGVKWILEPFIWEDVKEADVSFDVILSKAASMYPYPLAVKEQEEMVDPGKFPAKALWMKGGRPFENTIWLKVALPHKERWLLLDNDISMQVTLHTETRKFSAPYEQFEQTDLLQPGTYTIFTNLGEWSCVETDSGKFWIRTNSAMQGA
ncbi:hypothetical protein BC351_02665 [Paenibacillus ferrarius]|uniref:Uncharacterized protein n=1 Tax=Paenibacillus ferrarius TaxID=1469647 RepID=A0A1V4HTA8_9BACL|nr:hypothetical protein [Paenibacillus ferrarius]OPH62150.1 hypothetical protein BC351_02665 [Paenibacillus ferrarius]